MMSFDTMPAIRMPSDRCCNCSSLVDLQIRRCQVATLPVSEFGGDRHWLTLPLPLCKRCLPTATRPRPSVTTLIALSIIFGLGIMMGASLLAKKIFGPEGNGLFVLGSFLLGPAVIFGVVAMLRTERPQTSYFCPVWIDAKTNFRGNTVQQLKLCFSNADYARTFEWRNHAEIQTGILQIRVATR